MITSTVELITSCTAITPTHQYANTFRLQQFARAKCLTNNGIPRDKTEITTAEYLGLTHNKIVAINHAHESQSRWDIIQAKFIWQLIILIHIIFCKIHSFQLTIAVNLHPHCFSIISAIGTTGILGERY